MTTTEELLARYSGDPRLFRFEVRMVGEGLCYGDVAEEWQEDMFRAVESGRHCWFELPRGHDKSGVAGWIGIRLLLFGRERERILIVAADIEQGRIIRQEIEAQIRYTPWLRELLTVNRNEVQCKSRGSVLVVMSSDVASSFGERPTVVIFEELCQWPREDLWDSLWGSLGKRGGQAVVVTNAGAGRCWRWDRREVFRVQAEQDPKHWHFFSAPGWLAEFSREFKRTLELGMSPMSVRRYIENVWLESSEDAFLTSEQVSACFRDYDPREIAEAVPHRVQAVDLGITHDSSAIAVVGADGAGQYALLDLTVFPASKESPVDLALVEEVALRNMKLWGVSKTVLDPYEARALVQRREHELHAEVFNFTAANIRELTNVCGRIMRRGKFKAWPGAGAALQGGERWDLEKEMRQAVLKSMPYGERLDHSAGGYSDRLISVCMALWRLAENPPVTPLSVDVDEDGSGRAIAGRSWGFGCSGRRPSPSQFDRARDPESAALDDAHSVARSTVDTLNRGGRR